MSGDGDWSRMRYELYLWLDERDWKAFGVTNLKSGA